MSDAKRTRKLQFLVSSPSFMFSLRKLNNVEYQQTEGRLVVLGVIMLICSKLPTSELRKYAEILFVPLVLGFANDTDRHVEIHSLCITVSEM